MTSPINDISAERVKAVLDYDPVSGIFTWKISPARRIKIGSVAGSIHRTGYRNIKLESRTYLAHRLAWLIMKNDWPAAQVDHINGRRDDNRFENLREATHIQNCRNRKINSDNATGFKGVTYHGTRFIAQISIDGVQKYLGIFYTAQEAAACYEAEAATHFLNFRRGAHASTPQAWRMPSPKE